MKKKASRASRQATTRAKTTTAADEKAVALTLKIDNEMYIRLSTLRAKERRSPQAILTEALEEYLRRVGA